MRRPSSPRARRTMEVRVYGPISGPAAPRRGCPPTPPARRPAAATPLSLSLSPHCCGRGVAGSLQLPTSWARLAPFPLRAGQLDTLEAQCQHSDVLAGDIYIPPVGWGASHLWEAPA